jgi:predicted O-methyltransferase YrrM
MGGLLNEEHLVFPLRHLRATRDFRRFPRDLRTSLGIARFARLLGRFTETSRATVERYCGEATLLGRELRAHWAAEHDLRLDPFLGAAGEALYVTVRCLRPERMVETGVQRGVSTAFLLAAMERSGRGTLSSIDLPTFDPAGRTNRDGLTDRSYVAGPERVGDLVDGSLRRRWSLRPGDARSVLPEVLETLGTIDAFFHDSEHSYEQMTFEYEHAWRHLRPGGCLISDDVAWSPPARKAWTEFVAGHGGRSVVYFSAAGNRGMVRKD